jgi:uncharacterized protein (DUF1778 family)
VKRRDLLVRKICSDLASAKPQGHRPAKTSCRIELRATEDDRTSFLLS